MRLTPPAIAISHSPRRMLWQATWTAVSDEEHTVSTGDARAAKVEAVRDAVGDERERVGEGFDLFAAAEGLDGERPVAGVHHADEDADLRARRERRRV